MKCRFPFTGPEGLDSRSGPDVVMAALSEALRDDPRFIPYSAVTHDETVVWYPLYHWANAIRADIDAGRRIVIGPNVAFGDSQHPGLGDFEQTVLAYQNYAGIFTLSRWYSALQQKHFAQKSNHFILDFPLPRAWLKEPWNSQCTYKALIFIKSGIPYEVTTESLFAHALESHFSPNYSMYYGRYKRSELLEAARTSAVCFYISREDHYPLAAVEIGLMGCPIISDEKICSVLRHGINGLLSPVRERGETEPFKWVEDAAARMLAEWPSAAAMDRRTVREATIAAHDPARCRERIAAQLGLNNA